DGLLLRSGRSRLRGRLPGLRCSRCMRALLRSLRLLWLLGLLLSGRDPRLRLDRFADAATIERTEHDHHIVWLLGIDQLARGGRPVIGLATLLDADQSGVRARLAHDADLRRVG